MRSMLRVALFATAISVAAGTADATLIGFYKLTNNGPDILSPQLSADVTSPGAGLVHFKIMNAGPIASVIGQIYFDDNNTRLSNMVLNTVPETTVGVEFEPGGGNLPSGNTAVPPFNADIAADAKNPVPLNGVNPTEMLGILFDGNLTDVLADIANGDLRLGLHVQSIGATGNSDGYISVPEPASSLGVALSIALLLGYRPRS